MGKLLGLVSKLIMHNCECICGEELDKIVNDIKEHIEELEKWMSKLEEC